MSNILFTKKFLASLTSIIRKFWWTCVQEGVQSKPLCLHAWSDICRPKKEGGLGIKNIQATNMSLLCSAAWRIAQEPNSMIARILKAKYHPGTTIWLANKSVLKSAFWASLLKVWHHIENSCFYQIVNGNISIWSTPWCHIWKNIHDHLIIQSSNFSYPAVVRDLWVPGTKTWNVNVFRNLFSPYASDIIINTPIIQSYGEDMLCWKHNPSGTCTSKRSYRITLQEVMSSSSSGSIVSSQDLSLLRTI